jgi:hypothetical protein
MRKAGIIAVLILSGLSAIAQTSIGDTSNTRKGFVPKYERTSGYTGWVEAGINFLPVQGRPHYPGDYFWFPSPSLIVFNGVRLNRNITLGIELGMHATTYLSGNARFRYNLYLKPRIALTFDLSAGYAFAFPAYNNEHGFNFTPSVGFKVWGKNGRAAFTYRLGYTGIASNPILDGDTKPLPPLKAHWNYYSGIYMGVGVEF